MNKDIVGSLKVFAATAILASGIVLSECDFNNRLSEYTDEEIKEECERRTEEYYKTTEETKKFEPGEHIVQIVEHYTLRNDIESRSTIECPEGYELISSWCYHISSDKAIGYIYCNTVPVKVKPDEDGEFTNFGTPIEMNKVETTQKVKIIM